MSFIDDIIAQLSSLSGGDKGQAGSNISDYNSPVFQAYAGGSNPGSFVSNGSNGGGITPPTGGLGTGLGMNIGTGQLALGGLGALTSVWGGMQANKLANDQFKFTKQTTNTNLNNQIKSYNTSLEDRITSRAAVQGNDQAYVNDYLNKNKLSR